MHRWNLFAPPAKTPHNNEQLIKNNYRGWVLLWVLAVHSQTPFFYNLSCSQRCLFFVCHLFSGVSFFNVHFAYTYVSTTLVPYSGSHSLQTKLEPDHLAYGFTLLISLTNRKPVLSSFCFPNTLRRMAFIQSHLKYPPTWQMLLHFLFINLMPSCGLKSV